MIRATFGRKDREGGAVLVFAVLIMLALTLLVHGALVEALAELAASQASARQLRAASAARSAVQRTLDAEGGTWMDSVAPGEIGSGDTLRAGALQSVATMRRLDAETWLVEGTTVWGGVQVGRSGRLAWSLDPFARVSALDGAISVGTGALVRLQGVVDATAPTLVVPPDELGACEPWLDSLSQRYAGAPLAPVATLPAQPAPPVLGLLAFQTLLARVSVTVADTGTPRPLEAGGACVTSDPWNWGDPERPWGACGAFLALRASTGDLRVEGGSGQGVLVVDGALTLSAGTRFRGLVVVSGALRLEDSALFEGMALAAGGIDEAAGATVTASPCWAARALAAQRRDLGRMLPLPGTGWLGPL